MVAPYTSGLLEDFWRGYRQKRIGTGIPLSSNEMSGLVSPMLAYDAQKAEAAGLRAQQQSNWEREFAQRQDQINKADRAANISGLVNIGQLGSTTYLGAKYLGMLKGGGAAGANAGITGGAAGVGSAIGPSTTAPLSQSAALGGGVSGWGTMPAGAPTAPAATTGLLSPLATAASLGVGQYMAGGAIHPWMKEHGMGYTAKGLQYAGLPGAVTGLTLDVGKKVFSEVKDVFKKLF